MAGSFWPHQGRSLGPPPYLRPIRPMFLKRILYYLNPATLFTKTNDDKKMRFMNGSNRISIFVFLVCLVIMVVRALTR